MIYTLTMERLRNSTLLVGGVPLPPPEQMPPTSEWIAVTTMPIELDRQIVWQDVLQWKELVANQIVFNKTPARLRITWTEPGGKLAGKRFDNPRELIVFDDMTFNTAKNLLLESLEVARIAVENEQQPQPPIPAIPV